MVITDCLDPNLKKKIDGKKPSDSEQSLRSTIDL